MYEHICVECGKPSNTGSMIRGRFTCFACAPPAYAETAFPPEYEARSSVPVKPVPLYAGHPYAQPTAPSVNFPQGKPGTVREGAYSAITRNPDIEMTRLATAVAKMDEAHSLPGSVHSSQSSRSNSPTPLEKETKQMEENRYKQGQILAGVNQGETDTDGQMENSTVLNIVPGNEQITLGKPLSYWGFTSCWGRSSLLNLQAWKAYYRRRIATMTLLSALGLVGLAFVSKASGEAETCTLEDKQAFLNNATSVLKDYFNITDVKLENITAGLEVAIAELTNGTSLCQNQTELAAQLNALIPVATTVGCNLMTVAGLLWQHCRAVTTITPAPDVQTTTVTTTQTNSTTPANSSTTISTTAEASTTVQSATTTGNGETTTSTQATTSPTNYNTTVTNTAGPSTTSIISSTNSSTTVTTTSAPATITTPSNTTTILPGTTATFNNVTTISTTHATTLSTTTTTPVPSVTTVVTTTSAPSTINTTSQGSSTTNVATTSSSASTTTTTTTPSTIVSTTTKMTAPTHPTQPHRRSIDLKTTLFQNYSRDNNTWTQAVWNMLGYQTDVVSQQEWQYFINGYEDLKKQGKKQSTILTIMKEHKEKLFPPEWFHNLRNIKLKSNVNLGDRKLIVVIADLIEKGYNV